MYASPVAYPLSAVPEQWRAFYILANPVTGILDGFHRTLAQGVPPDPRLLALSAASAFIAALGGYWVFKRMEPAFAERI